MLFRKTKTVVARTSMAKMKAMALLENLFCVRDEVERCIAGSGDPMSEGAIASRGAIDRAIEVVNRVIGRLGNAMELVKQQMDEQAIEILDQTTNELDRLPDLDYEFEKVIGEIDVEIRDVDGRPRWSE